MKPIATKVHLVTEKRGTFVFENHWSAKVNFIDLMFNFESCNYNSFGEVEYHLFLVFEDGQTTATRYNGTNASANLIGSLEDNVLLPKPGNEKGYITYKYEI